MKIIALMNSFWVGEGGGMSGGDRRFLEVAKWWKQREVDFEIFASATGVGVCRNEGLGGFCKTTTPRWTDRLGVVPSYLLRTAVGCWQVPKLGSNLTVYSSSDFLPDVLPALAVKFLNRNSRWVALIHHVIRGRRLPSVAQRLSFFLIKNFSDSIIVPSNSTQKDLLSFGFSEEKITVVPNGLDTKLIAGISGSEEQASEACFLARLKPSKGIYDLPEIWQEVTEQVGDARLAVMGGGSPGEVEKFKNALWEAGVWKNVKILGFVSEEEKYTVLKSSKIFISPSREEGFGISVLEAMACGLPVVAWDLPVYREIFKKGMVRISLGDHQAFAATIVELLGDEEKRAKMGQEAKSLAQKYDWEKVAEKEWALLDKQTNFC